MFVLRYRIEYPCVSEAHLRRDRSDMKTLKLSKAIKRLAEYAADVNDEPVLVTRRASRWRRLFQ
jgi:hypothetical protein